MHYKGNTPFGMQTQFPLLRLVPESEELLFHSLIISHVFIHSLVTDNHNNEIIGPLSFRIECKHSYIQWDLLTPNFSVFEFLKKFEISNKCRSTS